MVSGFAELGIIVQMLLRLKILCTCTYMYPVIGNVAPDVISVSTRKKRPSNIRQTDGLASQKLFIIQV